MRMRPEEKFGYIGALGLHALLGVLCVISLKWDRPRSVPPQELIWIDVIAEDVLPVKGAGPKVSVKSPPKRPAHVAPAPAQTRPLKTKPPAQKPLEPKEPLKRLAAKPADVSQKPAERSEKAVVQPAKKVDASPRSVPATVPPKAEKLVRSSASQSAPKPQTQPEKAPPKTKSQPAPATVQKQTTSPAAALKPPAKAVPQKMASAHDVDHLLNELKAEQGALAQMDDLISKELGQAAQDEQAKMATGRVLDKMRQQFTPCWHVPGHLRGERHLTVAVRARFSVEGELEDVSLVPSKSTVRHPGYRVLGQTVLRAVKHPQCLPLKLPRNLYDTWKDNTLLFSPQDM